MLAAAAFVVVASTQLPPELHDRAMMTRNGESRFSADGSTERASCDGGTSAVATLSEGVTEGTNVGGELTMLMGQLEVDSEVDGAFAYTDW